MRICWCEHCETIHHDARHCLLNCAQCGRSLVDGQCYFLECPSNLEQNAYINYLIEQEEIERELNQEIEDRYLDSIREDPYLLDLYYGG
jgi:hypothetical protein